MNRIIYTYSIVKSVFSLKLVEYEYKLMALLVIILNPVT
jgi:hypothetical protein